MFLFAARAIPSPVFPPTREFMFHSCWLQMFSSGNLRLRKEILGVGRGAGFVRQLDRGVTAACRMPRTGVC